MLQQNVDATDVWVVSSVMANKKYRNFFTNEQKKQRRIRYDSCYVSDQANNVSKIRMFTIRLIFNEH